MRRVVGITLIEVMVSVVILGLVILAIYSTWTAVLKSTRVGLDAAIAAQRERLAMETFSEALGGAKYFAANLKWYWFDARSGEDAALSFVSQLPKAFPRGGRFGDIDVRRVTFALEGGPENTRQLVLRQQPLLLDMDEDEQKHPLVLMHGVKTVEFEFWDVKKKDWVQEWTQTNTLPKIVRVSMELAVGNGHDSRTRKLARVVPIHADGVQAQHQLGIFGGGPPPGPTPFSGNPGAVPGGGPKP
jgi:Tfp pilus assembly protein PilE